jgi:hypothetical protein
MLPRLNADVISAVSLGADGITLALKIANLALNVPRRRKGPGK